MEINRLLSDELSYELVVRGASGDGTVVEKRQRLRGLLKLEKLGSPIKVSQELHVPGEEELEVCVGKLDELEEAIHRIDMNNADNEYRRIQSRLLHVMNRISRVPGGLVGDDAKSQLLSRGSELLGLLEEAVSPVQPSTRTSKPVRLEADAARSILDEPNTPLLADGQPQSSVEEQSILLPNILHTGTAVGQQSTIPVGNLLGAPGLLLAAKGTDTVHSIHVNQRGESTLLPLSPIQPRAQKTSSVNLGDVMVSNRDRFSRDPSLSFKIVSNWNLKFDGSGSVSNFLERVEELSAACSITEAELLNTAIALFSGMALSWFRSIRSTISSWGDLSSLLKATYLSPEYEEEIWMDIRNRSQGADEKAAIFIGVMENLFNRLSEKQSESKRLTIIRRNLLPHLQNQLALVKIDSIPDLIKTCQTIEGVRLRTERLRPPPSNPRMVAEPQLMYRPTRSPVSHTVVCEAGMTMSGTSGSSGVRSTSNQNVGSSSQASRCFNCNGVGHLARNCAQPFRRRCFRCGKAGVTVRTCPSCSGNSNAGSERTET